MAEKLDPKTRKARLLLVDDDRFLLEFFSRILHTQGYYVVHAHNGSEAKKILTTEPIPFSLVIVDLLMPEMNGWKLISDLRSEEKFANLPIIALTGMSLSYQEYEKLRNLTNAVLLKGDFDITRFLDTIRQFVDLSQSSS